MEQKLRVPIHVRRRDRDERTQTQSFLTCSIMANRFVRLFQTMSCRDIQRLNVSASKNEVDSILASASHVNHGSKVRVQGWVKSVRSQKNVTFINLNDGSSQAGIQIIANPDAVDVSALSTGCSMAAEGKLSLSPGAKQSVELHADNIQLIGGVQQVDSCFRFLSPLWSHLVIFSRILCKRRRPRSSFCEHSSICALEQIQSALLYACEILHPPRSISISRSIRLFTSVPIKLF